MELQNSGSWVSAGSLYAPCVGQILEDWISSDASSLLARQVSVFG